MNAFRWKSTVGPWEQRPGHFNDVWNYWMDDGLGFFEFLQVCIDPVSLTFLMNIYSQVVSLMKSFNSFFSFCSWLRILVHYLCG
jgi:alpha-L-arabinofuranosidase